MGFDCFGEKPKSSAGAHFRNNLWYWNPLWTFICETCGDILTDEDKHGGGYNYICHVIDEDKALKIGARLLELIDSGVAAEHGKRPAQEFDCPPGMEDCNHTFSVGNVKSFADFCLASGGFFIT